MADQPAPTASVGDLWADVIRSMEDRRQLGLERYGRFLQAHNGRDALRDATEELLDMLVYLHQMKTEWSDLKNEVVSLRAENAALRAGRNLAVSTTEDWSPPPI